MTGITWLHLSDWHEGAEEFFKQDGVRFDRNVVLRELIDDISNRESISNNLKDLDFIVFSGDVAFSGKEYGESLVSFFDELLKAAGLTNEQGNVLKDRLFIVPGNHDLDRSYFEKEIWPDKLKHPLDNNQQVQTWLTDQDNRTTLLKPFEHFSSFVKKYTNQENPEYASVSTLDIKGKKVALLGINSALMAGREVNDETHLIIGEAQIFQPLRSINDKDIRIAVLHHPLGWLKEFERDRIRQLIMGGCHFILHGHRHKYEVSQESNLQGDCVTIAAGSSYDSRDYSNGYNFVCYDPETRLGRVYLRRWDHELNKWVRAPFLKQNKVVYNGCYEFPPKIIIPPVPKPIQPRDITQHYRDLSQAILRGVVVPFLGADINLCDRPNQNEDYKPSDWQLKGNYPPTNLEIAAYIDSAILEENQYSYLRGFRCPFIPGISLDSENLSDGFPHECPLNTKRITRLDLPHVSQYIWSQLPSLERQPTDKLENAINAIYQQDSYSLNSVHQFLVNLCQKVCPRNDIDSQDESNLAASSYPLIVTTCFDQTLERAFREAEQPFDLVSFSRSKQNFIYQNNEEKPVKIDNNNKHTICNLEKRPVILRLYGRVGLNQNHPEERKDFAITEDHFIDYLTCGISDNLPTTLWRKLTQGYLWFLGYSLSYWNLRFIVRQINKKSTSEQKPYWWVVQENPEILDKELWGKIGADFYGKQDIISFKKYIEELTNQLSRDLKDLPKP